MDIISKKKTHEQFIKEFNEKNPSAKNIEILSEYLGSSKPIYCKCKIDGYEWKTQPSYLLGSKNVKPGGCPRCSGKAKKTTEEFKEEMKVINLNIEILGEYINSKIPIECKCKLDGYKWSSTPNSLLYKKAGCPICGGTARLTHEQFIKKLTEKNSNIEVLGKYINNRTHIKCKCKIDEYEWSPTPNTLLRGSGCPMCSGNIKRTTEEFIKKLTEKNSNIEVLGEYINSQIPIKCKCKIDEYIWYPIPNNLLRGSGCPKCNTSKGEKAIVKYLEEHNISFKDQYKFDNCKFYKNLLFDFYIPDLNITIEYDGEDHYIIFTRGSNETYEEAMDRFIDTKIRDTIKNIYCQQNNIKLIRIPYWDFDNIEDILDKIF